MELELWDLQNKDMQNMCCLILVQHSEMNSNMNGNFGKFPQLQIKVSVNIKPQEKCSLGHIKNKRAWPLNKFIRGSFSTLY